MIFLRLLQRWESALLQLNRQLSAKTQELTRAYEQLNQEVQERTRTQAILAEQAIRDTLTGLFNRRHFTQCLDQALASVHAHRQTLALLLCDVDRFKQVNDSHGHQTGDNVLRGVSESLLRATRGTDLVFRWGGDEFIVILTGVDREGILTVAARMRRAVRQFSRRIGLDFDLSIGVAIYPEHADDTEKLLQLADRALYIAKRGGDKIHIGIEEFQLSENTIKAVFQPVVDITDQRVIAYEALARDAQDRLSVPQLFQKYNSIGQLTELKSHCFRKQLEEAQRIGVSKVFVNVDFTLLNHLKAYRKPPGLEVVLEISDVEALHDLEGHLELTRRRRRQGYHFAIDDFGAGFLSLPFIAQLVPDYIKIDRTTILQAVSSPKFRIFLGHLLVALRNYSVRGLIAEGIEAAHELETVRELGISLVQGYLLGKPEELKPNA